MSVKVELSERAAETLLRHLNRHIEYSRLWMHGGHPYPALSELVLMEAVVEDTEMPTSDRIKYNQWIQAMLETY